MKNFMYLLTFISSVSTAAVSLNHDGIGEVLLLPYYTVNNELNTLVSLSNTADTSTAIKIIFTDALANVALESINVYLAPNDVWTWGMAYSDEGAQVISVDKSCTPMFHSPMTLVQPGGIPIPRFEGMIEIYEMGELDPKTGFGKDITFDGQIPIDCQQISDNWEFDGAWTESDGTTELLPASGGLMAAVSLVDVGNGINYSYDAVAIEGFYPDNNIIHTAPFIDYLPSLKSANTISSVLSQGEHFETVWPNGFEAISAILSKQQLLIDYSIETGINAQTEMVLSFPTKAYHYERAEIIEPFNTSTSSFSGCEFFESSVYNRDTTSVYYVDGGVSPVPSVLCANTSVIKIWDFYAANPVNHPILDAKYRYNQSAFRNSAGLFKMQLNQHTSRGRSDDDSESHTYFGLPVIGIYLNSYTNSNAQPGLLAQYGGAFKIKSTTKIEKQSL